MSADAELAALFAPAGPFPEVIPGYRSRPQQVEMAAHILTALERRERLVVEAGTGTGKTLSYLVPLLLHGGKAILSTGSKTLQDQVFHRDIPAVRRALRRPIDVALLKGRANYVCRHHLERALAEGRFASREDVAYLQRIARFAALNDSGDRMALAEVPENAPVWAAVTSTRDNCLGSECPQHRDCFVLKARRRALQADLVVVNHHLFFADVWLKDEGAGELLPIANAVVFDEAHQLPEIASVFFGESITTGMLIELARDAHQEARLAAADCAALPEAAARLDKAARDVRLALGTGPVRLPEERAMARPGFRCAVEALRDRLAELVGLLGSQAERAEGLGSCHARALDAAGRLARWLDAGTASGRVRWCEATPHTLLFHATPLDIGVEFARRLAEDPRAWIFVSATLSVRGDFSHYLAQLGLDASEARCGVWDSPYDYSRQALLYCPRGLPDPNTPEYTAAVVDAAWPLLLASQGRAFMLFTSLKAMHAAHPLLQARLDATGDPYPLLLQGERSRSELLDLFRAHGNAILLGSQSFWEGVDIAGEALSLVVIDRLPFQPPDDPVLAARMDALRRNGCDPFFDYQLPQAVITLKQGAGRLIRREDDRGVLMICDPRLVDKPYGRRILQSLPPMRRSRELAEAVAFLKAGGSGA